MFTPDLIFAFLTLTFLEIILGIDNIIFISILASRFPEADRKKLMRIGLLMALFSRILLLMGINWLVQIQVSLFSFDWGSFSTDLTIQSLILVFGGLFLLYKSTKEIYEKAESLDETVAKSKSNKLTYARALFQIVLIDIVFSFDSILTAVGMTNGIPYAIQTMVAAVVLSILIMMLFAAPVSKFINTYPSLQILGLAFLLLIGFMLITEAAHLSHTTIFGSTIGAIPKGYLYFAIAFSLGVEMINIRFRKKKKA
jgi:predicted tellurium resistance membrane protein TerC